MRIRGALYLSFKNIYKSRKSDLFRHIRGAVLGIALSLVPLIVVLQIADGMIQGITGRYIETGSYHFQIRQLSRNSNYTFQEIADIVKENDEVENAFVFITGTSLAYTENGRTGIPLRGIPAGLYKEDPGMRKYMKVAEGSFDLTNDNNIILSRTIADKLGARTGDQLKILTAYSLPGRPPLLKPSRFKVAGIVTTGYNDLDDLTVFIKDSRAERIFRDNRSRQVGVKIKDPFENTEASGRSLKSMVPPEFFVMSWERINYTFYKSLETTKKLLVFIMLLILGVASVNISSSMIMMVNSARKEIAVLKSVGFSSSEIVLTYILTGFIIGFSGTFSGITAGILCSLKINEIIYFMEVLLNKANYLIWLITGSFTGSGYNPYKILNSGYYLEKIPVNLNFSEIYLVALVSLFLAVTASFLPSLRAGKIKPVEIFQKY